MAGGAAMNWRTALAVVVILVIEIAFVYMTPRVYLDTRRLSRDIDRACKQAETIMARWKRP
jgi:hypothetical protein